MKKDAGSFASVTRGLLLLLFWVVLGTYGFSVIEGWTPLDAIYMTLITITTVGYGEIHPLSNQGRLFASVLILGGIGTAVYTFTRLGQWVFEGELSGILGRRRMKTELERLKDHFIVCGFGRVGRLVAEGLVDRFLPFCVVENNPTLEEDLQKGGYLYLIGDATEEEILREAGVGNARVLLALLPTDAENLYLTMSAKEINPKIHAIARAMDEKAEMKLKRGGADEVVSPYRTASMRVLQAAVKPTVVEFIELATSRQQLELSLEEVKLGERSGLVGHSIAEAEIRRNYGVIIVAIKRSTGEMVFNPDPSVKTVAGDTLVAIGKTVDLKRLEEACQS